VVQDSRSSLSLTTLIIIFSMREDLRDSSRNGGKVEVEFEEDKKRKLECVDF
jgi:hypothetical protein